MSKSDFDQYIIAWNNQFPLDRWFRNKYKIAFNSLQHQEVNQIDIFFEYREEKLFEKHQQTLKHRQKEAEEYKKGNWIKNKLDEQFESGEIDEFDLFDKIDISQFNTSDDKS